MFEDKLIYRNLMLKRRMREKELERQRTGSSLEEPRAPFERRRKRVRGNTVYVVPTKQRGYRDVQPNSRFNERGFTVFNGHDVQHESGIEHRVCVNLQTDPDVVDIQSQGAKIFYNDAEGKKHYTVFDFVVTMKNGEIVGVAVKEEEFREEMEAMFEFIAATDQTQIDRAIFISDRQATMERFANARYILWAREHADRDEVKFVSRMIYGKKTVQFWELYDDGALGNWSRKAAIWRLIDLRVLAPMNDAERINDLSRLTINL